MQALHMNLGKFGRPEDFIRAIYLKFKDRIGASVSHRVTIGGLLGLGITLSGDLEYHTLPRIPPIMNMAPYPIQYGSIQDMVPTTQGAGPSWSQPNPPAYDQM